MVKAPARAGGPGTSCPSPSRERQERQQPRAAQGSGRRRRSLHAVISAACRLPNVPMSTAHSILVKPAALKPRAGRSITLRDAWRRRGPPLPAPLLRVLGLPEAGPPGGDRRRRAPSLPEPRRWGMQWVLRSPRCLLLPIAELLTCPVPWPGGFVGDGSLLSLPEALGESQLGLGPSPGSWFTLKAQSPGTGTPGSSGPQDRCPPSPVPGWVAPPPPPPRAAPPPRVGRRLRRRRGKMAAGTAPRAVFQEPVTFEDVAVFFSAEEWRGLVGWQKGLYRDMMMENYQLIASLGSACPKPEVVLKLERGEEPHLGDPPAAPTGGSLQAPGTAQDGVAGAAAGAGCSASRAGSRAETSPARSWGAEQHAQGRIRPEAVAHPVIARRGRSAEAVDSPRRRLSGCPAATSKRKELSLADRVKLLQALESSSASLSSVAKLFGISKSQAGRIGRCREQILADWRTNANPLRKRKREGKGGEVEDALFAWCQQALARGERLSGPILKAKAEELALSSGRDFEATDGWLCRWKTRHNIVFKRHQGEKADADVGSAQSWVSEVLPALLASYRAQDIFSAEETGLLYRSYPARAQAPGDLQGLGGKRARDRVSVLCCTNHTGTEKRRLLVVGRSRRLRCLPKDPRALPVTYASSANAWVTARIFQEWILRWDRELCRHRRRVVLFVGRSSAHPPGLRAKLCNIRLVFFPPDTSSVTQPMDVGVIPNLKGHYRALVLARAAQDPALAQVGRVAEVAGRVTLLDAIYLLHKAWRLVQPATVQSCFWKAGFHLAPPERREADLPPLADVPRPPFISEQEFLAFVGMDAAEPAVGEAAGEDCSLAQRGQWETGAVGGEEDEEEEEEEGELEAGSPVTATEALAGLSAAMKWCQLRGLVYHWERLLETESTLRMAVVAEAAQGALPARTGYASGTVP
ncbi:uncharacterized protein M6G45_001298 [Spheniscus humboldti]